MSKNQNTKNKGWITISRDISESDIWNEGPFSRGQAWVDLIIIANYKPGYIRVRGERIELKRGDVGHSMKTLADRWQWSRGKVERFLKELEKDKRIIRKTDNRKTVISICNYSKYQDKKKEDGHETGTRRARDGHETGTRQGSNNKDNKDNKNKQKGFSEFEIFWNLFPKEKRGRKEYAMDAWQSATEREDPDKIIDGVKIYANSLEVKNGILARADNWLNNDSFLNQYEPAQKPIRKPVDTSSWQRWQKDISKLIGDDATEKWLINADLQDETIYLKNAFASNWVKKNFGIQLKKIGVVNIEHLEKKKVAGE